MTISQPDQVPALIRSFDIMLMPSIYESETFGVAAVEASASGVPVIASKVGGVPEAVLHNQTGLLVPPRDPAALAHATIELIDDPSRRRQMGLRRRRMGHRQHRPSTAASRLCRSARPAQAALACSSN